MMEISDARSLALAGANVSDIACPWSVQVNPASVCGAGRSLQAIYSRHPVDIWSGRLGGATSVRGFTVGGFISAYSYGEFDESPNRTGSTGATFTGSENLAGGFIGGKLLHRMTWGIVGKVGWWNIADASASAGAFDVGIAYNTDWEGLRLGVAVKNLGSQWSSSSGVKSPLPQETTLGGARKLNHLPLTLNAAVHLRRQGEGEWDADFLPGSPGVAFSASGEFEIQPPAGRKFDLRFGYRSLGQGIRVGRGGDALAGFSFGFGLAVRRIIFDYTYAPLGLLGDIHRFGVSGTL